MNTDDDGKITFKVHTDEEIRAMCNETTPHEAFFMVLSLFQRTTLALESIAQSLCPLEILAEQEIGETMTTDGSAEMQHRDRKTDH